MRRAGYCLAAACTLCALVLLAGCRKDLGIPPAEVEQIEGIETSMHDAYKGIYIVNNGGKGSSKATLDYLDLSDNTYHRNIFAERNPSLQAAMGDNATDIAYYNGHIYVVLNGSSRIIQLKADDASFVRQIHVNDCGKVAFFEGKGYVTSRKKEGLREDQQPFGEIIQFDPESMAILSRVTVGCQPEEMIFLKPANTPMLYVSNAGEYLAPNYDSTISAINLTTMRQEAKFVVGPNPRFMVKGINPESELYVTTQGNFVDVAPSVVSLKVISGTMLMEPMKIPCIAMVRRNESSSIKIMEGDLRQSGWFGNPTFSELDPLDGTYQRNAKFINDTEIGEIQNGTNFVEQPDGRAYLVFDGRNFTSSGMLYCYNTGGKRMWKIRTGIIPIGAAFVPKNVTP